MRLTFAPSPSTSLATEKKMALELIKLDAEGNRLAADATDWVAVELPLHGLTFTARPVITDATQQDCEAACWAVTLFGDTWDGPTIDELSLIVDRTRRAPAINTDFFRDIPSDWAWTKSPWINRNGTESASAAWLVLFYNGYVNHGRRNSLGFALAVRRAGQ